MGNQRTIKWSQILNHEDIMRGFDRVSVGVDAVESRPMALGDAAAAVVRVVLRVHPCGRIHSVRRPGS